MINPAQAEQIARKAHDNFTGQVWVGANDQGYVVEFITDGADPYAPDFVYIDAATGTLKWLSSGEYIKIEDSLQQVN